MHKATHMGAKECLEYPYYKDQIRMARKSDIPSNMDSIVSMCCFLKKVSWISSVFNENWGFEENNSSQKMSSR